MTTARPEDRRPRQVQGEAEGHRLQVPHRRLPPAGGAHMRNLPNGRNMKVKHSKQEMRNLLNGSHLSNTTCLILLSSNAANT